MLSEDSSEKESRVASGIVDSILDQCHQPLTELSPELNTGNHVAGKLRLTYGNESFLNQDAVK